jgi:hypothetical protein
VKFRRKSAEPEAVDETGPELSPEAAEAVAVAGPFDVDDVAGDEVERVDLGSLLITPEPGRELRLQVDEATQAVQSVVLAGPDGALELRAFSAPRNGDLWTDVRPQLAADMARRGGTATEREGRFGTELVCQLSVQTNDGKTAQQPSRIVGFNGPRWMLRGTFLGRPAVDVENAVEWEDTLAKVVVRRGDHAMPVGDPLPLTLPENARRTPPPPA